MYVEDRRALFDGSTSVVLSGREHQPSVYIVFAQKSQYSFHASR